MTVRAQLLAYFLEQLAGLGSLRSNRMFSGVGLYCDELFFGLIYDDTLYFKTDESNIAGYRDRRMPRFMPFPDRPGAALGYHQVPADVIEDSEVLVEWARKSVAVALAAKAAKAPKKSGRARKKSKVKRAGKPRRKKTAPRR